MVYLVNLAICCEIMLPNFLHSFAVGVGNVMKSAARVEVSKEKLLTTLLVHFTCGHAV